MIVEPLVFVADNHETLSVTAQPTVVVTENVVEPEPELTLRLFGLTSKGIVLNAAVTLFAALIVTWQEPVPLHDPLQPANKEPVEGVGVSVTTVTAL